MSNTSCKRLIRGIFFVAVVVFLLSACGNNTATTSSEVKKDTVALTRLGESPYYLNLPANYRIEEARGKEGQVGYNILSADTASTMHGFIEIEKGHSIMNDTTGKDYSNSVFLNKQITWKISTFEETGYQTVRTPPGDVTAWATANKHLIVTPQIANGRPAAANGKSSNLPSRLCKP